MIIVVETSSGMKFVADHRRIKFMTPERFMATDFSANDRLCYYINAEQVVSVSKGKREDIQFAMLHHTAWEG